MMLYTFDKLEEILGQELNRNSGDEKIFSYFLYANHSLDSGHKFNYEENDTNVN